MREQSQQVVLFAAPCAIRVCTGHVTKRRYEFSRLWERQIDPRREHGISAGNAKPSQRIRQRFVPLNIREAILNDPLLAYQADFALGGS